MKFLMIVMALAISAAVTSSVWASDAVLLAADDLPSVEVPSMTEVEAADYAAADLPHVEWKGNRSPAILEEQTTVEDAAAPFSYNPSF